MYISQFNPWKFLNSSRKALGRMGRNRGGRMRRNPVRRVAGGGGHAGENQEGAEPHL